MAALSVLVLSNGPFSGITKSLVMALRRNGCTVQQAESTLRFLPWRSLALGIMAVHALLWYRLLWRRWLNRTSAAFRFRSQANERLVRRYSGIDIVLQIGANALNFWPQKRADVRYAIFTDHTHILSRRLPNYGFTVPEWTINVRWVDLERSVLLQQDHVFVMGGHVGVSMVEDYGLSPARVSVVGGGPNLDLDIEHDGIQKDYYGRNILFVGLDSERKGLDILKKAFQQVIARFPDATLHIVGVGGNTSERIRYYGPLHGEPLKQLFYQSQIFALPTFREPFGVAFIEAMWAKNVCIGTRIEAIPEIIREGTTGYLITPGDVNALAEYVCQLFADRDLLCVMAEAAYQTAKSQWHWDRVAQIILRQFGPSHFKN